MLQIASYIDSVNFFLDFSYHLPRALHSALAFVKNFMENHKSL